MKFVRSVLSLFLILTIFAFGLYRLMNSPSYQLFGSIIPRVETSDKVVALTFDDGPNQEQTDYLLQLLADQDIKATFYLVGGAIQAYPVETGKLIAAGHALGNHSYSHQRLIFKSPRQLTSEIDETNRLIRQAGYTGEITFRPPHSKKLLLLPWLLNQRRLTTITWDVDPLQHLPADASTAQITDWVVTHTKPGSIILLHPWYRQTNSSREAIPQIISTLKTYGYRFVTINELLP